MKKCRKCEVELVVGDNWTSCNKKNCKNICRDCDRKRKSEWAKANRDKCAASKSAYYKRNAELVNSRSASWAKNNPEKRRVIKANWQQSNKDKRASYRAKRRASKLDQTPEMNRAELVEIEEMYRYHQIFNGVMPEKEWHVDHINALANGGLHHPSNLQVLTAHDNLSKGARV